MKTFSSIVIFLLSIGFIACNDAPKSSNTHTHDDGSVHEDHATDTAKPNQQQFNTGDTTTLSADPSAKPHVHKDGKKHTH